MFRIRSFRGRVFVALLAVALVPGALLLASGALGLSRMSATTGTLGPWQSVAESGRVLVDSVRAVLPADHGVVELSQRHQQALSASVQQSRLWAAVTARVADLLPWLALLGFTALAVISAWVARMVSRSLAAPVAELVDWTGRIARGHELPASEGRIGTTREFRVLGRALRDAARAIVDARDREVESAELRAWTNMARQVAHELKNPLTPMRMSAASLMHSPDPQVRESAEILLEEIARLDDMARDFSQFGRPPEGPRALVDLSDLVTMLAERYRDAPVPVQVTIRPPIPLIEGHHDLLERAVRNLLENALEAVADGRGSRVTLTLTAVPQGVRLQVFDDGPGVDPRLRQHIWMPEVTTRHRGTGLGLALVRRATELHQGSATLLDDAGDGTTFVLELPIHGMDAPSSGSSGGPDS